MTVSGEQQRDSAIHIHVSVLHLLSHVIFTTSLRGGGYYYPCFIAAETKAQRGEIM